MGYRGDGTFNLFIYLTFSAFSMYVIRMCTKFISITLLSSCRLSNSTCTYVCVCACMYTYVCVSVICACVYFFVFLDSQGPQ